MHTLELKTRVDTDGHIRLDVYTGLPEGEVELLLVIDASPPLERFAHPYNFSDLTGKLHWSGDATEIQRALRDEWQ